MASSFYTIQGTTADGSLESCCMSSLFERGYISIKFYTDSTKSTQVTPTAGKVTFLASEDGGDYGTIPRGTVDATKAPYQRPNFSGSATKVRATTSGIVGAGFYVATIYRFGDN